MKNASISPLLLLAIGVGGLLIWSQLGKTEPAPPPPTPTPPSEDPRETLRRSVAGLLAQAAANPLSVNPDIMAQLATDLDTAGMANEAAQVRAAEALVRAAQAGQPPPITTRNPNAPRPGANGEVITPPPANQPSGAGAPSSLPLAEAAQARVLLAAPNPDVGTVLRLAARIDVMQPGGGAFPDVVRMLRNKANAVAAGQVGIPGPRPRPHPFPSRPLV